MTYIKTLWKDGVSLIDAEKMNKLEEGVRKNNEDITATNAKFDRRVDETNTNLNNLSTSTDRRFQEANDRMNVFDETLEGNFVTCNNTIDSIVKKVVVLGKSYQNPSNLDEIKASGIDNGDGTFTYKISSCGKNLFNINGDINQRYPLATQQGDNNVIISGKLQAGGFSANHYGKGQFIKVPKNTDIIFGASCEVANGTVMIHSSTQNNIASLRIEMGHTNSISFNTGNNTEICIAFATSGNVDSQKAIFSNVFLGGTSYEEYKEDVATITLPCQLEEHDQLYYDTKEEAWCVAKYNTLYTFTGAENIIARQDILVSERSAFGITGVGENTSKAMISKFRYLDDDSDAEHFRQGNEENSIIIFVNKSSLDVNSVEGFRSWMLKVGLYMKYPTSTPRKIVLPKDVQVQLNQYLGTTNAWISSGDVDAKLKITFNKSLGSAVQANAKEIEVLDSRVTNIEGLKTSQDMAYGTDKGFLVCKNTKNGVVKDLKVYGKSLKNELSMSELLSSETNGFPVDAHKIILSLKPNTKYVLYSDIPSPGDLGTDVYFNGTDTRSSGVWSGNPVSQQTDNSGNLYVAIAKGRNHYNDIKGGKYKITLLEENKTDNLPPVFEGIASVGSGVDEMEIASYNSNILDIEKFLKLSNGYTYDNGVYTIKTNTKMYSEGYKINHFNSLTFACKVKVVDKMTNFRLRFVYTDGTFNESNMTSSTTEFVQLTLTSAKGKIVDKIACNWTTSGTFQAKNWQLTLTDSYMGDIEGKQDTEPILFKDTDGTWKPIPVLHGKWKDGKFLWGDTVELHPDGKYYWHKRCGKDVLDGTQKVVIGTVMEKTCSFNVNLSKKTLDNSTKIISTRYKVTTDCYREDIEGMYGAGSYVYMRLDKTVVNTAEGMKSFLQANPVEVVYLLAEEEVYEVNFLVPSSFEGDTLVCYNSGIVSAPMEFKLTSNISSFISEIDKRLDFLEDNFHKQNLAMLTIGLNTLNNKLELKSQTEPQNV